MASDCSQYITKCNKALEACDAVIEEKNKTIDLAGDVLKKCVAHGAEVQYQLNVAKDELNQWYRNPFIVGALGLLGGFALSKTLLK